MKQFDPPSNQGADAPNHDTQVEEANTRTDQANTRTRQANIRTEEAEARTVKANTQTDEANIRTEQSEARSVEALKASGLLYRRLFETAQDGILILDADTAQVVDANPFMKDLLGYSQEEFLGKKLWEIGPFKGEAASKIAFAELQRADCIRYEGLPLETKAGLRVEVEFISNAYLVDQKRLIQCNIRDITERKKAEAHLQLQVRALEAAANAIVITDSKGVIEWVNPAFTAYTGYSAAEAIGKNPRLLKSGKHDVKFYQGLWETILAGKTWHGEMIDRRKDGTLYNEEITITPMRDIKGEIAHFIAIKQDITKRKEEEEQLLWKTAFLEAQVNSSLDGILILNNEQKKILQNQRMID